MNTLTLTRDEPTARPSSTDLAAPGRHMLQPAQCLAATPTAPLLLRVLRGRVWLTLTADADDHVLGAGAVLRLPAGVRVVLEAWHPDGALVQVAPAAATPG